jgi:hypothetical protein
MGKTLQLLYGKVFYARGKKFPAFDLKPRCCDYVQTYRLELSNKIGIFVAYTTIWLLFPVQSLIRSGFSQTGTR